MSLNPASVLITGANRGIGLEFVKQFLGLSKPPAHVFAACRSPDNATELQEIAKKSSAVTIIKIDLGDLTTIPSSVKAVQEKLGGKGLSLLINNAGILKMDNLDTIKPEVMVDHYNVHVVGPLVIVQNYLPLLKLAGQSGSGMSINSSAVVNINTGMGSIEDNTSGKMYAYRTAKCAQNMLTKTLSVDLKKDNILVTSILPGWVATDMGGKSAKLSVEGSVQKMFNVMKSWQSENSTGKFYQLEGKLMPW